MHHIENMKSNRSKYVSWHLYSTLPYTYTRTNSQISMHSMTFSFFMRFLEILLYSKLIPPHYYCSHTCKMFFFDDEIVKKFAPSFICSYNRVSTYVGYPIVL